MVKYGQNLENQNLENIKNQHDNIFTKKIYKLFINYKKQINKFLITSSRMM